MKDDTAVIGLKAWTIKRQGAKFFIAETRHFGDGKHKWRRKSYTSLQKAITAIARLQQAEWIAREQQMAEWRERK